MYTLFPQQSVPTKQPQTLFSRSSVHRKKHKFLITASKVNLRYNPPSFCSQLQQTSSSPQGLCTCLGHTFPGFPCYSGLRSRVALSPLVVHSTPLNIRHLFHPALASKTASSKPLGPGLSLKCPLHYLLTESTPLNPNP